MNSSNGSNEMFRDFYFNAYKGDDEEFSDNAPDYRKICKGLNLEGICKMLIARV